MSHILSISIDVAMNCDLHEASEGESHNSLLATLHRGSEAQRPVAASDQRLCTLYSGQHCHEVGQALPPTLPLCHRICRGKQQFCLKEK